MNAKKLGHGKILHIETKGAIVNIRENLLLFDGRLVDSVAIYPDRGWEIVLPDNTIKRFYGVNIRIRQIEGDNTK